MAAVFSGGLVYEYSEEANGYGIVEINGNSVDLIGQQFTNLQQEFRKTANPSGDGGYSPSNPPQECPGQSENWDTKPFTGSALPACPSGALKYFKQGAGKGPGLSGLGSQEAAGGSSATASASAGAVTVTYGGGSSPSSGATSLYMVYAEVAPFTMYAVVWLLSFAFGALIL